MANKFILKRSSVANKVPLAANLDLGELALNTADGRLFTKKGNGAVVDLGILESERAKLQSLNARPFTIAVIGDSMTVDNALETKCWPDRLEDHLNANRGATFRVHNFADGGVTFFSAMNTAHFSGKTPVQAAIESKPDLVIVGLGGNDLLTGGSSRTLAQVKADASAVFSALRSGLPSAILCSVDMIFHDKTHGTPSTLTSRQVIPYFWARRTTGILANCMSAEIAADAVSSVQRGRYANLVELYTYISGLSSVDHTLTMDVWRVARLGGISADGLHVNELGQYLQELHISYSLNSSVHPVFSPREDPDALFLNLLQSVGGEWVTRNDVSDIMEAVLAAGGAYDMLNLDMWMYGYRASFIFSASLITMADNFYITVSGGRRSASVLVSYNNAAFSGPLVALDTNGDGLLTGVPLLGRGVHAIRFKVGSEVFGPFTISVVNEWIDLTPYLQSPWYWNAADKAATSHPPQMRRTELNRVELRGIVTCNATPGPVGASVLMRLPEGYRPQKLFGGVCYADAADPLWFGSSLYSLAGENVPQPAGTIIVLPQNPPATVERLSIDLNSIHYFLD